MLNPPPGGKRRNRLLTRLALVLTLMWVFHGPPDLAAGETGFTPINGPCRLIFPEDHGPHAGYRTEWWYYTGHLADPEGRRFGFQLTIFRLAIKPRPAVESWPRPASPWRTRQLYVGHAALSLAADRRHLQAQKVAREALQMAGATQQEGGQTHVFIDDWFISIGPQGQHLAAKAENFEFDLRLTPKKPPVAHGEQGYSRKGRAVESASCYYSFTRLFARGRLRVEGGEFDVEGFSWMDHEFSSAGLEDDIAGWDWFSLQLSDHTELMIYLLRTKDGGIHPASAGTFVEASGQAQSLRRNDVEVQILDHWKSPDTGARYPSGWKVAVPRLALDLAVRPTFAAQEMRTVQSTGINYWEGSTSATGQRGQGKVSGCGYVELTGYDRRGRAMLKTE